MKKSFFYIVLSFLLVNISLFSQEIVKVVAYNVLNYSSNSNSRNEYFKLIMNDIDADIVMVEEIEDESAVNDFLSEILGEKYKAGTFVQDNNGFTLNRAIFYKDSLFEFISNTPIYTGSVSGDRDINEFKVVHRFTLDTLYLYCAHLKADNDTDARDQRTKEVNKLRAVTNVLPNNAYFLLAGDLNVYSALEECYDSLLSTSNTGYFIDPLDESGTWHNSSKYSDLHTQSTRSGDEYGGLDDRFDQILISNSIYQPGGIDYVDGSYAAYGNDGNHFNESINDGTNSAVSSDIADALYYASDHLPVVASFDFGISTGIEDNEKLPVGYDLAQNYPNPFNPTTTISYQLPSESIVSIKVYDILGRMVAELVNSKKAAGSYEAQWNASKVPSGVYFYSFHAVSVKDKKSFMNTKKMILMK